MSPTTVRSAKVTRTPDGPAGTRNTLERMRQLVERSAMDPDVIEWAIRIVRRAGVAPHDYMGEARAVFAFVRDQIRYTRDPAGVELLRSPRVTLAQGAGDCDDKATLLAGLLRALGNPARVRFRAIGTNPLTPQTFSHVYVVARVGPTELALDPTWETAEAGWEYPTPAARMEVAA